MKRPLTPRQEQVLHMLAAGLTTVEIGRELWLETETVRWHLKRIYANFGVHTRAEAIAAFELAKTCCHACGRPLEEPAA